MTPSLSRTARDGDEPGATGVRLPGGRKSQRRGRRWLANSVVLAVLLGVFGLLCSPQQANAATTATGCEQQRVTIHGITYAACLTLAQPCLRVHDLTTFAVQGCLPFHTSIDVFGQWRLPNHVEEGSDLWDSLKGGGLVLDAFVNTSHVNAPSPPLPTCAIVGGPGWMGGACHPSP